MSSNFRFVAGSSGDVQVEDVHSLTKDVIMGQQNFCKNRGGAGILGAFPSYPSGMLPKELKETDGLVGTLGEWSGGYKDVKKRHNRKSRRWENDMVRRERLTEE